MSAIHLHLALNHLPILLFPLAALLVFRYLLNGQRESLVLGTQMALAGGLLLWPVYQAGTQCAELVGTLPIDLESQGQHQQGASLALALGTLVALTSPLHHRLGRRWLTFWLLACLLEGATLLYCGWLGGKIRHTELETHSASPRSGPKPPGPVSGWGRSQNGRLSRPPET